MNLGSGYLSAMRAEYRRLTGTLPGEDSDIGIRMALLANQLELLEEELTALKRSADPETAEGAMLDRHADSRGLRPRRSCCPRGWWLPPPERNRCGSSPPRPGALQPGRPKR